MYSHNVLALDYGARRIGVASANMQARMASPLITIDQQDHEDIFVRLKSLFVDQVAETVVVGLPRGLGGQETAQTASVRAFAKELETKCGVAVFLQDEAATSIAAEEDLKASGKPYQKGDIDMLSACYILRDWLASEDLYEAKK